MGQLVGRVRRGVCIPLRVKVGRGGRAGADMGGQGGKEGFDGASFKLLLLLNCSKQSSRFYKQAPVPCFNPTHVLFSDISYSSAYPS